MQRLKTGRAVCGGVLIASLTFASLRPVALAQEQPPTKTDVGPPASALIESGAQPAATDEAFRQAAEAALRAALEQAGPDHPVAGRIAVNAPRLQAEAHVDPMLPPDDWPAYRNAQAGYVLFHPPDVTPAERADPAQAAQSKIVSALGLGEHIQIVTRIPPLDDETFTRWTEGWTPVTLSDGRTARRYETAFTPPDDQGQVRSVEYFVHTPQADYRLQFSADMADTGALDRFEQIARAFTLLDAPAYTAPAFTPQAAAASPATAFDFPVAPRDGSANRAPSHAGYNVRNPYLHDCDNDGVAYNDDNDRCWSRWYGKTLSQLQHTGEDWFRPAGSPVYAVANGRVVWSGNANYPGYVVIIEHELPAGVSTPWGNRFIYSMYGHLAANGLIQVNADVQKGQTIGVLYDWEDDHLHWEMRRYWDMRQAPGNVNGYRFNNSSIPGPAYADTGAHPDWFGYTHPSAWVDAHRQSSPPPSCPQSGGVILYYHANYDCGGRGENEGYVLRSGTGMHTMPAGMNDQASSIRIPNGWSVRVFEHSGGGGGRRCYNAPGDNDFSNDSFDNGIGVNDRVSSVEIFSTPNCAANAPDTTPPSGNYTSPGNGATVGRTVRLAAWASDSGSGVREVRFTAKWSGQWRLIYSDAGAPYEYDWDLCAAGVPDGDIELGLDIWDHAGNEFHLHTVQPNPHITKSYNCSAVAGNWSTSYWNNKSMSGAPNWQTGEAGVYLLRDWGYGGPGNNIRSDEWSARFVRTVYFPGGEYRFHCQHDDGCRIFIDGQNRIDAWWDSSFDGHDWAGYLSPGNHEVRVEYFENQGRARVEVWWQGPGYLPRDGSCSADQWCAEYRGNRDMAGPPIIRRNEGETLWHDWGSGGPDPTFPSDNFSSRFFRNVYVTCGTYRFHLFADDGVRFWVDDVLRLDQWRDQVAAYDVDLNLSSGTHALRVEHYENGGGAAIRVGWEKLADCPPNVTVEHASTHYAQPGAAVEPLVHIRVANGYLQGSRGDNLSLVGGFSLGAATSQPVYGTVNEGSTYTFDVVNSSNFRMRAPSAEGTYDSRWRVRAAGNLVGPEATVRVVVDGVPPAIALQSPTQGAYLNANTVTVRAALQDANGIDQAQFFVGYSDNSGWAWRSLGWDLNGSDGWQVPWNPAGVADQQGVAFYVYAWDRAGNGAGASTWSVTLDRTPPTSSMQALTASQLSTMFVVRWSGQDAVSGLERFEVQVREDDGAWQTVLSGTQATALLYFGQLGHRYAFRVRAVDRAGNVQPYPAGAQAETFVLPCSGDTYEPDNGPAAARTISAGVSERHTSCGLNDEDWVRFWVRGGTAWVIRTRDLTQGDWFNSDTVLTLYAGDGATVLAENDDFGGSLASWIMWRPAGDGWYYARVRQWAGDRLAGDGVAYTLALSEMRTLYLPAVRR
ncbi:MAG: hypothetical protein KatS3mg052_0008 [Candidatus Roseilinea sp.]|nr:MAG: hypothetical protein KatS3mg052_0008 [Candidatus Roseilinea sp.]